MRGHRKNPGTPLFDYKNGPVGLATRWCWLMNRASVLSLPGGDVSPPYNVKIRKLSRSG